MATLQSSNDCLVTAGSTLHAVCFHLGFHNYSYLNYSPQDYPVPYGQAYTPAWSYREVYGIAVINLFLLLCDLYSGLFMHDTYMHVFLNLDLCLFFINRIKET